MNQSGEARTAATIPLPPIARKRDLARFTGAKLSKRQPKKYRAILKALFVGEEPIVSIARRLHCSPSTVMAIRERESANLGTWKELTAKKLGEFVTVATERLSNEVDKLPLAQLPVAVGIAIDKKNALEADAASLGLPQEPGISDISLNYSLWLEATQSRSRFKFPYTSKAPGGRSWAAPRRNVIDWYCLGSFPNKKRQRVMRIVITGCRERPLAL